MANMSDPIVVEQLLPSSPSTVWKAITDPAQMREWFFDSIEDFRPEVGFETCFNVECDGNDYLHRWEVTEVVPKVKLVYRWRYDGYPGDSHVSWELIPDGDDTLLKFTHTGHDTFPQDNEVFSYEACLDGWHYFITQTLPEYLEANRL